MSDFVDVWRSASAVNRLKPKFQAFDDRSYGLISMLNKTDGMMIGGVVDIFPAVNPDSNPPMDNFRDNNVFSLVSSKTFSGCVDCNSKMTITKYFNFLFEMLVSAEKKDRIKTAAKAANVQAGPRPRSAGAARGRARQPTKRQMDNLEKQAVVKDIESKFSTEVKTYYIILSGLIEKGKITTDPDGTYLFQLDDVEISMWSYRYVVIWCLLQIMFACWEESTIEDRFRHHVAYVYDGIQSFYLSLLFFAMHCTRGVMRPLNDTMRFNVFHFFYSSHLPFFLISKGNKAPRQRSLSACILDKTVLTFADGMNIDKMRNQFSVLKESVMKFWNECFEPLSDFLLGRQVADPAYGLFFCNLDTATQISDDGVLRQTTVQSFKDYFTAYPDYWFHFKSITVARIEEDCDNYVQAQQIPLAKELWNQWYNHFSQCVLRLGMGHAAPLGSRFRLLGDGPKIHLATYLRAYGPQRWRTRVCV